MRQVFCAILFLCICNSEAYANEDTVFRNASRELDAGMYKEAAASYLPMAQEKDHPWDLVIATINLGRSLLGMHDADLAAALVQQTLENYTNIPPLLQRELMVLLAESFGVKREHPSDESYRHMIAALRAADDAVEADCQLQRAKGFNECSSNRRLVELRGWITQSLIAQVAILHTDFLAPKQLTEALWRLEMALLAAQEKLSVLKAIHNDSTLFASHREVYLTQIEEWKPLVDTLATLEKDTKATEAIKNAYTSLLKALKNDDIPEADQNLQKALKGTKQLTLSLQNGESREARLQRLIALYTRTLEGEPLQQAAVALLFSEDKNTWTEQAVEALVSGEELWARLLLEEGREDLIRKLLPNNPQEDSVAALTAVLEEQRHAAHLVHLMALSGNKSTKKEDQLFSTSQKAVTKAMTTFTATVYRQQEKGFRGDKDTPPRCQKRPWDEVLPLFHEGEAAATAASKGLEEEKVVLALIYGIQKGAIKKWDEALTLLKAPLQKGSDGCYGGGQPSGSGGQAPQEIGTAMERVETMEMQDRLAKPQPVIKKRIKAW